MKRERIALLTEGNTTPLLAKMAAGVLRYRGDDVCAVIDSTRAGEDVRALLEVRTSVPIVATLEEAPEATVLMLGITPAGGALPESWRPVVHRALKAGIEVWSGLHVFLHEDAELSAAARRSGTRIRDLRHHPERPIARAEGLREDGYRVLTVGQDVCVGKMCVALELTASLRDSEGRDARFLATGQTGIAIAGGGAPIDALPADFVAGAAESLVLNAQSPGRILIGEGQGSLAHPSFSGVTLGLLHGFAPDAMIFCFEAGRRHTKGLDHVPLARIETLMKHYESMAALRHPARIIGFGVNARQLDEDAARALCADLERRFGHPATDVIRFGAAPLANAVQRAAEEKAR